MQLKAFKLLPKIILNFLLLKFIPYSTVSTDQLLRV